MGKKEERYRMELEFYKRTHKVTNSEDYTSREIHLMDHLAEAHLKRAKASGDEEDIKAAQEEVDAVSDIIADLIIWD